MREMKDSGIEWIGKVPSTWNILRNKNAFFCTKNLVGTESTNTQLLSLTTKGIRKKDINNAEGKLPESFDTYQYVRENDIVMCLFDLDCSAVFSGISFYNGMISPAYRVLTCKKSIVPRYAHYWFNYVSDGRKFNHYAKNIRYTISYDEFSTLPILCPDIETQQRLSAYLDEKCTKIDIIIEKQQKIIEKLKAYKLSLITETVTKGLNPDVKMKDSGVEWIGEIPEHWNTATISKVAKLYNGDRSNNYPSGTDIVDEGILFVTSNNLNNVELDTNIPTNKFITKQKYDSLRGAKLKINDIIFCLRGSVGKCGINYKYNAGTIASSLICIRSVSINPSYLNYSLHTSIVVEQAKIEAIGIGSQNLSAENIARVIITIPSSQEQQEIADYLDKKCSAIDSAIKKKQALIEKLTEYKKSLIYEVVTGKREVSNTTENNDIVITFDPQFIRLRQAALTYKIIKQSDSELKGRIHLMKILYIIDNMLELNLDINYIRYTHGPYNPIIESIETKLSNMGDVEVKKEKNYIYKITGTSIEKKYNDFFRKQNAEIEKFIDYMKGMKTSKAEKIATLYAAWNDFLIDGIAKPTDDMIITDVMTNWTKNKAKTRRDTWKKMLSQMKTANIVPHGYGKHTIRMED